MAFDSAEGHAGFLSDFTLGLAAVVSQSYGLSLPVWQGFNRVLRPLVIQARAHPMPDVWLARLEVNLVQRHSFIDKRPSTGNIYGPMPDDAKQPRPSRSFVRPERVGLTPHRQKRFLYHILTQLLVAKHPICDGHCRALWRS